MKIEPQESGDLRIWMTDNDMERWGLQWDMLASGDATVDRALLRLLRIARARTWQTCAGRVIVEAIPVLGGCLLLFSGHSSFHRSQTQVYLLETADAVVQLAVALTGITVTDLPSASLYRDGERYWLTVEGPLPLLDEFALLYGEGLCAGAYVQEHAEPLVLAHALTRLQASCESHAPGSSHLPH